MTWREALPVLGILVLASSLAFLFLADKSFWLDEGYSVSYAHLDLGELWELVSHSQANMSLYYFFLHSWLGIGESEFAIRSLSVLFAAMTVPLVYGIGRRLLGVQVARGAALLFAVNPFVVRYAQEARGYSLALCLVCLSTYLFIRALQDLRWTWWLLYASAAAISLYAHFFAGFVLLAHLLTAGIVSRNRVTLVRGGTSALIVITGVTPLILFLIFRSGGQINWIEEPSLNGLLKALSDLAGGNILLALLFGGLSLFALATRPAAQRQVNAEDRSWRWLLGTWLAMPIGLSFIISFLKPILLSKYLIIALPPLVLLAAKGLLDMPSRLARLGIALLTVGLVVAGLITWYSADSKEEWRGATAYVLDNSRPGDGIILYSSRISAPFNYYVSRLANPSEESLQFIYPVRGWGNGETLSPGPPRLRLIRQAATEYSRIWLVLAYASGNRKQVADSMSEALEADSVERSPREFRRIHVQLFE